MSDQHKEIECELLEIYNKNLDRFFSLIKFIFLIFGVYILTYTHSRTQKRFHFTLFLHPYYLSA